MTLMTRRAALGAGAALPIAAVLPAQAAAPMQEPTVQNARRFMLGDLEVTTLLANTLTNPTPPQEIFGMNVDAETFAAVSAEAFIPADVNQFFFTPTLVNNGESLILFDTGQSPEDITAAVESAGYATGDIDAVVRRPLPMPLMSPVRPNSRHGPQWKTRASRRRCVRWPRR